ncbi:MAG TPA: signal recognition particle protein [Verrucomicrobiae bacterium]|nr:signal recognition particle protein [Verrucomicrobiae bacterium]
MLEQLSDRLQTIFKNLRGFGRLSESNIADACREIRMALLEADVNFSVARELVEKIRARALGQEVLSSITPGQQMVKVFRDELAAMLGEPAALASGSPLRILLCGLQGSGKTTTAAKLALFLKRQGRHPLLVAADLQRPAAILQLQQLGAQADVPVYANPAGSDPSAIVRAALDHAATQSRNVVIVDTAGRTDIDETLLAQLTAIEAQLKPQETLFVADAALGQKSVDIVTRFSSSTRLTGLILTRLDGDARGGAAISMRHVTGLPIKLLGTGEKLGDVEAMDPGRLAGRILGMGDVIALVEKAQEVASLDDAQRLEERFRKRQFDMEDLLAQFRQMRRLGPMENLLGMLPGGVNVPDSRLAEDRLRRSEAIILSMTSQERRKPDLLNARRRQRIAKGSGTTVAQVNELMNQFGALKKMMQKQGPLKKMLARMGKGF